MPVKICGTPWAPVSRYLGGSSKRSGSHDAASYDSSHSTTGHLGAAQACLGEGDTQRGGYSPSPSSPIIYMINVWCSNSQPALLCHV